MRVQLIGAAALARLMQHSQAGAPDLTWLLHGPTDEDWVEPAEPAPPAFLLAAE